MTDTDKAKDYLCQIRKTDRLINRLLDTVQTLRSSLTSQSYELNPDKVQTSGPKNTLENTMTKVVDLEADINRYIDELVDLKQAAIRKIQNIPDQDQQNVLLARYVSGMKWEKIAVDLNFSIAQIYRIHGAALLSFLSENPDILKDDSK
jgi:DNA-directed RNA polymerase specialized sigma subunit